MSNDARVDELMRLLKDVYTTDAERRAMVDILLEHSVHASDLLMMEPAMPAFRDSLTAVVGELEFPINYNRISYAIA